MTGRLVRSIVGGGAALALAVSGAVAAAEPARAAGVAITAASPSITKASLKRVKVPSMCEHRAGRLTNGSLPGVAEGRGGVWLVPGKSKIGQLRKGAKKGAVAVFGCSQGGVNWPEHLVFYDARGRIMGHSDLGFLKSPKAYVRKVTISKRTVTVQVTSLIQDGEDLAGGSGSALLKYRWSNTKHRMVLVSKSIYTPKKAFKKLLAAVNRGDRKTAKKYATADALNYLTVGTRLPLRYKSCRADGERTLCQFTYRVKGGTLRCDIPIKQTGWRTYRAY